MVTVVIFVGDVKFLVTIITKIVKNDNDSAHLATQSLGIGCGCGELIPLFAA